MSKKAVLRTAQDIFVLDKAFFLIEGHPSDFEGFRPIPTAPARLRWIRSDFDGFRPIPVMRFDDHIEPAWGLAVDDSLLFGA
jgi:hypothetical protein